MGQFDQVVKKIVLRFGHDKSVEDREDFESECQIAILENEKTIDHIPEKDREKYVYILCKNKLIDYLKSNYKSYTASLTDLDITYNHEPNLIKNLDAQMAVQKMDSLPEPYRSVLRMRFCEEPATFQEIGNSFGKTKQWAEQIEKKGLKMLRKDFNGQNRSN